MTRPIADVEAEYLALRKSLPNLEHNRKLAESRYFAALEAERTAIACMAVLRNEIAAAVGCPIEREEAPTLANGRW